MSAILAGVLVVARITATGPQSDAVRDSVAATVAAWKTRPGHVSTRLARALDDPEQWVLVSEWESVGAYRRALSSYDAKVASAPLMGLLRDEPTAYEVLWVDSGEVAVSDRSDGG